MQSNIENCDDTEAPGNEDSVESKEEIKSNLIWLEDLIHSEHIEILFDENEDYISYENFKLKNEEIEMKFECNDGDDIAHSTHECELVDVGKQISNDRSYMSSTIKEEQVNYPEINDSENITNQIKKYGMCHSSGSVNSNKLACETKRNIGHDDDFKHNFRAKKLIIKLNFNDHYLLKMHKASSKMLNSNHKTAKKTFVTQHKFRHGLKNGSRIFKCQHCTYTTRYKTNLTRHIKMHENIKDFKCTFCSKAFTVKIQLDDHILNKHKNTGTIKKLHSCDQCNYESLRKRDLLLHKLKHGIKDDFQILKCPQCTFETYRKTSLDNHVKIHKNKDFKCNFCSKEFTTKYALNYHLLRIHKSRDTIQKLYSCDQCSCEYLAQRDLLNHKIKHGLTDGLPILKCNQCTFETYRRATLDRHVKIHKNKDFKCTLCSNDFTTKYALNYHLLRIHKSKDAIQKLYSCDQCSCEYLAQRDLLDHKIKHGLTDGLPIFKCSQCTFETYRKNNLKFHFKIHQNIKDFKCAYCSKEFTYKCNLERHLLTVHNCRNVTEKTTKGPNKRNLVRIH